MRNLNFNKEDVQYDVCYGAMITASYVGTETRIANRVLEKLEKVGQQNADGIYELVSDAEVKLEEADFALMKRTVESTRWIGRAVRNAVRTMDWLEAIKEED